MMYAHDKQTAAELEQVKRYRLNHRINAAGTLAPPVYPAALALDQLAVKLSDTLVDVWTVEGRTT